jgi:hypothetical protein
MKSKHILNTNLPLSQRTFDELKKGLKHGCLKCNDVRFFKNKFPIKLHSQLLNLIDLY